MNLLLFLVETDDERVEGEDRIPKLLVFAVKMAEIENKKGTLVSKNQASEIWRFNSRPVVWKRNGVAWELTWAPGVCV